MVILAFDTSGPHCAVALVWPGGQMAASEPMAKGQAEYLLPMIDRMMADAGFGWPDITSLAVGTGPGNFTGIRIAVALARGLALGLGISAQGVTGFDARAHGHQGDFWVAIPAPRDQTYAQKYGRDPQAAAIYGGGWDAPLLPEISPDALALAIARSAAVTPAAARPAPFYLRAADALPSSDPPPVILP